MNEIFHLENPEAAEEMAKKLKAELAKIVTEQTLLVEASLYGSKLSDILK